MPPRSRPGAPGGRTLAQGLGVWLGYVATAGGARQFTKQYRRVKKVVWSYRGLGSYLREQSIIEGVLNGRRSWLAVGVVVWGARALHRAGKPNGGVIFREVLQPGERVVITQAVELRGRKARRAARASA